jgi:small multidrug resistance pump
VTLSTGWLLLLAAAAANGIANLLIKRSAMAGEATLLAQYLGPWFLAGVVFFGCSVVIYAQALQSIAVSVGYPVMVGVSTLLVLACSMLFLKEALGGAQLAGVALIVAGVVLAAR